ncbi:MAG TPA: tRNA-dihydrouridine synthase [Candidatus Saccharibacteria bacterium]|nr:tRNA-dihydrouridine synthase [Candidatus Saccharibacteria bacterium]
MKNIWHNLPRPFFILAPMEAVTDVVFRHVVKKAAAPDLFFTEFTNATGWVHAGEKAIRGRLIKTEDENPIIAQIWGGEVGDMARLAEYCRELGYQGIDINMGCPAKSAVKSGGSALIRNPELAAAAIAAAKTAGLPVSVKTRLGYTHIAEWRDWLTHLLRQDIVNLTIHLRTKKEMSKVPAHFELIPEIVALRDEIAPHTLLTINGDIRDRAHGEELVEQYGVDGVMIGRGIFHNPFAFAATRAGVPGAVEPFDTSFSETSAAQVSLGLPRALAETWREAVDEKDGIEKGERDNRSDAKTDLLNLLNYHLDLYDQWQPQLQRPFETLKRFFKIYIRDFDGASELRNQLMQTKSTDEVRKLLE